MDNTNLSYLAFTSHHHLSTRLVLSTLTGKSIRITKIRNTALPPGLAAHEISFLRLLDAVTNGSHIEFNSTGTALLYKPGLIAGSAPGFGADADGVIKHTIPATNSRGITYFLLPLCILAPFAKTHLNVLLQGPGVITSATEHGDISIDTLRTAVLPYFSHFGIPAQRIEIQIKQRSCSSSTGHSGGQVQLIFQAQIRLPKTLHLITPGRIKSIRGVAYAVGVAASNNARMIESARAILNKLVPDVRIFSDNAPAPMVDLSQGQGKRRGAVGFGISLVASSASGHHLFSADVAAPPDGGLAAEDVGRQAALQLLEVIEQGGCVPRIAAPVVLTLMAMGSEDVGRVVLGQDVLGNVEMVSLARDFKTFGLSAWGVRDADEPGCVVVSVVGRGVGNVGRKVA
jgi:RNA 3'-terminal phosphate cyclase-like protein